MKKILLLLLIAINSCSIEKQIEKHPNKIAFKFNRYHPPHMVAYSYDSVGNYYVKGRKVYKLFTNEGVVWSYVNN